VNKLGKFQSDLEITLGNFPESMGKITEQDKENRTVEKYQR